MNVMITGWFGRKWRMGNKKNLSITDIGPVVFESRRDFSLLGEEFAGQVEFVQGDVTDLASIISAINKFKIDRIVHMAAVVPLTKESLYIGFQVNALGSVNILEAAAKCNISRIIYTSSRAAYGSIEGEFAHPTYKPITEEYPSKPYYQYDVCKFASEGMGSNYARLCGFEFASLRYSAILGPGKATVHGPFGIFSRMIEESVDGKRVLIPKGGDQIDDVIYVADVAEATFLATVSERLNHSLYNISRNVGTTPHDMAKAIKAVIPDADIEIGGGIDYLNVGANFCGIMDNRRALDDFGFVPKFDLASGVADYIRIYREMKSRGESLIRK